MGDPWGTGYFWGRGLEGANKNKISPKTSKSTKKNRKKTDFFFDQKKSK